MSFALQTRSPPSADAVNFRLWSGLLLSLVLHATLLSLRFGARDSGMSGVPSPALRVRLTELPQLPQLPDLPVADVSPSVPPAFAAPASEASGNAPLARAAGDGGGFTLFDPVPALTLPPAPAPVTPRPVARNVASAKARSRPRVIALDPSGATFTVPLAPAERSARSDADLDNPKPALDGADTVAAAPHLAAKADADAMAEPLAGQGAEAAEQTGAAQGAPGLAARQEADASAARQRTAELAEQKQAEEVAEQQNVQRLARQQKAREVSQALEAEELLVQQKAKDAAQLQTARELAERQKAQDLAVEQVQRQKAQELAQQQEEQQLVDLKAAQELASRQREQELAQRRLSEEQTALERQAQERQAQERKAEARKAEEQKMREVAAQRRAEESRASERTEQIARQQEREAAQRQRAQAVNGAGNDAVSVLDGGAGGGTVPKKGAGADLGSGARDQLKGLDFKGLDVLSGAPPPASGDERARQGRRVLVASVDKDLPLRMYADSWRQKVERNGNMNYSRLSRELARNDPVVSVAIRSDGSVEDITVVRSSGRADLDEAVRRIVRINARYAAFPPNIADKFDVIEIRRAWRFDATLTIVDEPR
ncbi:MAG: TonB family protein [Pseudomonadota bacterium]